MVGLELLWDSSLRPGFPVLPSPGIGSSVMASQKVAVWDLALTLPLRWATGGSPNFGP